MIGKTLVHYEITAEIGKGGMGEVYQAKDTKLGRILLSDIPDYHREIDHIIIDPPYAAFSWRVTGTSRSTGKKLNVLGSSHGEFTDDGKISKYWVYVDSAQMSVLDHASS